MTDGPDIVVTAKPQEVTTATISGGGSPNANVGTPTGLIQDAVSATNNNTVVDADAQADDIIVVARKLKEAVQNTAVKATTRAGQMVSFPCISPQSGRVLYGLARNLKFRVTSTDYGSGRAGQNLSGSSSTTVEVHINKDALKGYDALPGGISYVVAHEIAHSFPEMRAFNKVMFDQFSAGVGKDMSHDERVAAFPNSPEFKANEARANTVAREIIKLLNMTATGFTPTHGYAAC